jgi:hypothetical protein
MTEFKPKEPAAFIARRRVRFAGEVFRPSGRHRRRHVGQFKLLLDVNALGIA